MNSSASSYDNAPAAISVSELVQSSSRHLQQLWPQQIWVNGELSNVRRYPSGHVYLTLKDDSAEISGVMFASQAKNLATLPSEGNAVTVLCQPNIYAPKGRLQIVINKLALRGQGQLYEEFIRIKKMLRDKGWFGPEHKTPLPAVPRSIAVVVSMQGAAWRDVRTTLRKRFALARVLVFPAPAQGSDAPAKIAAALNWADTHSCDVLLLCRGGGSFEDMHAYNSLQVAEAIWNAKVPVIAGIGHETDETIADFVADTRAATPTAAAVAAVPESSELLQRIAALEQRFTKSLRSQLDLSGARIDDYSGELRDAAHELAGLSRLRLTHLHDRCVTAQQNLQAAKRQQLNQAQSRLATHMRFLLNFVHRINALAEALPRLRKRMYQQHIHKLDYLQHHLRSLNPRQTLQRGYAIICDAQGKVLSSAGQLSDGTHAIVELHDGAVTAVAGERTTSKLPMDDQHNR